MALTPDFHLIDKTVKNISCQDGVELAVSGSAWEKYPPLRPYFKRKPQLGYFLRVKKSQKNPLNSCISLASCGLKQGLDNLVIIEKGVRVKIKAVCHALKKDLGAAHLGRSRVICRQGSFLEIVHQHSWGSKDLVRADINFTVEKGARLSYLYKNLAAPGNLQLKTRINLGKEAKAESKLIIEVKNKLDIDESLFIKEKNGAGTLVLRLVGREKAMIKALSSIEASAAGKGHLDCQGLMIDDNVKMSLVPKLVNKDRLALITHEASIGRIEKEKLEYLQSRGLTEEKAINLLVKGFLDKEN